MIPYEVAAYGRHAARRTGLDLEDGESIAGETWAAYPTQEALWRTIALRRCIDEARHRHGREHQHPIDTPTLDQPIGDDTTSADLLGCDDPNLEQVERRVDLVAILRDLDDRQMAALARRYWLGIPAPTGSRDDRACTSAIRRARRVASRPKPKPTRPAAPTPLTARQAQVLQLAADGNSTKQIAAALTVSPNTVKTTMATALRRLGVNDRTHAVAIALRTGLIA